MLTSNVLEKLRASEPLTDKERKIHVDLDDAVFETYGWQDLHQAFTESRCGTFIDPSTRPQFSSDHGFPDN